MDLTLEFKNGVMTGEGADGIGLFLISGNYSEHSGECGWLKQYTTGNNVIAVIPIMQNGRSAWLKHPAGRHPVDYKGYRDGKGIWGNWMLFSAKGGFHIWPLSEGGPVNVERETEPEAQPAFAPG